MSTGATKYPRTGVVVQCEQEISNRHDPLHVAVAVLKDESAVVYMPWELSTICSLLVRWYRRHVSLIMSWLIAWLSCYMHIGEEWKFHALKITHKNEK